ncbi:MAG: choice-of-anchor V domain-containing protein [Parvularculaceae bacterium]
MRLALLVLAIFVQPALAAPEGAPWDQDGGPGRLDCTQCHFDAKPVRQSEALRLEGLPAAIKADVTYELTLVVENASLMTAGFLMTSEVDGDPAGRFQATDNRTAVNGAAIRSTKDGVRQSTPDKARWTFRWTAPAGLDGSVTFYVAANASNDDASAFGDQIFLSTFETNSAD